MGKITGFMEFDREEPVKLPVKKRLQNYKEFELGIGEEPLRKQGARCMDCGIPFCNTGCPLGNLIPDWNDHVYRGDWQGATASLHETNNFPEITGRICPAPCEAACVLNINAEPVAIKLIERAIADAAFASGAIRPELPRTRTGKRVAVIGSGPAGLAAAQQLNRAGHEVVVFERDDRIGGLLTYGIPDFKLELAVVERRVAQLREEGVQFRTGVDVGTDITGQKLQDDFHAICLCIGSRVPRDLEVPGRKLAGIHFAMDFLTQQNRRDAGDTLDPTANILAGGKRVIVIGGGDTGSDCIGTSNRQGAVSVVNLELMPRPPDDPAPHTPWPLWPLMYRTSSSHEEGVERSFAVATTEFIGKNGRVTGAKCIKLAQNGSKLEPIAGSEFEIEADLVLLAMGFVHPEPHGIVQQLGLELTERGNIKINRNMMTAVPGVFAAGDAQRGQSLVVWAIADGRRTAREVDRYLMGRSELLTPKLAGVLR
ncbi:MAG TPA: glutamate synthase subunit beta [Polyangiaceae bacterium]|nr:glutamate synthase subunit beta [Polyangiaceae bacterium]